MRHTKLAILATIAAGSLTQTGTANADVIYTYTGNPFTILSGFPLIHTQHPIF